MGSGQRPQGLWRGGWAKGPRGGHGAHRRDGGATWGVGEAAMELLLGVRPLGASPKEPGGVRTEAQLSWEP